MLAYTPSEPRPGISCEQRLVSCGVVVCLCLAGTGVHSSRVWPHAQHARYLEKLRHVLIPTILPCPRRIVEAVHFDELDQHRSVVPLDPLSPFLSWFLRENTLFSASLVLF